MRAGLVGCVVASRVSAHPDLRVRLQAAPPAGAPDTRALRRYERGKVMGGGSSINRMMANRGAADYDDWHALGATCCPAGSACIDGACVTTCEQVRDATMCLVAARNIVQICSCGTVVIVDRPAACIDDADCPRDLVVPGDIVLDDYGCMVSFTTDDGLHTEYAGHCMGWALRPEVCPP